MKGYPSLSAAIHPFLPPLSHKNGWDVCKCVVSTGIHIFCYGKPSPVSPAAKPSPGKPNWHCLPNWEGRTSGTHCQMI